MAIAIGTLQTQKSGTDAVTHDFTVTVDGAAERGFILLGHVSGPQAQNSPSFDSVTLDPGGPNEKALQKVLSGGMGGVSIDKLLNEIWWAGNGGLPPAASYTLRTTSVLSRVCTVIATTINLAGVQQAKPENALSKVEFGLGAISQDFATEHPNSLVLSMAGLRANVPTSWTHYAAADAQIYEDSFVTPRPVGVVGTREIRALAENLSVSHQPVGFDGNKTMATVEIEEFRAPENSGAAALLGL